MKRIITIMACIGLLLTTTSWDIFGRKNYVEPSKKIVVRTVNAKDFTGIEASSSMNVAYYTATDGNTRAEITAPENYQDFIKVQLKGKTLHIGLNTDGHSIDTNNKIITVKVYGNHVNAFGVSSSADIDIMSGIEEPTITLTASSSGDIDARNLKSQVLSVSASSSADINITSAEVSSAANVSASSSADIEIGSITGMTVNLAASSSADLSVQMLNATTVNASATSSADMKIKGGACEMTNMSANTSGSLNASGLSAKKGTVEASTSGSIKSHITNVTSVKHSTSGSISNH